MEEDGKGCEEPTQSRSKRGKTKFSNAIYNKSTGEFLGRTPKSWLLIFAFYVVFYLCLAAFSIPVFTIFRTLFINERSPTYTDHDGIYVFGKKPLISHPTIGVRPRDGTSSLIIFNKNCENCGQGDDTKEVLGWGKWKKLADTFFSEYTKGNTSAIEEKLGPCGSQGGYGYNIGE